MSEKYDLYVKMLHEVMQLPLDSDEQRALDEKMNKLLETMTMEEAVAIREYQLNLTVRLTRGLKIGSA